MMIGMRHSTIVHIRFANSWNGLFCFIGKMTDRGPLDGLII